MSDKQDLTTYNSSEYLISRDLYIPSFGAAIGLIVSFLDIENPTTPSIFKVTKYTMIGAGIATIATTEVINTSAFNSMKYVMDNHLYLPTIGTLIGLLYSYTSYNDIYEPNPSVFDVTKYAAIGAIIGATTEAIATTKIVSNSAFNTLGYAIENHLYFPSCGALMGVALSIMPIDNPSVFDITKYAAIGAATAATTEAIFSIERVSTSALDAMKYIMDNHLYIPAFTAVVAPIIIPIDFITNNIYPDDYISAYITSSGIGAVFGYSLLWGSNLQMNKVISFIENTQTSVMNLVYNYGAPISSYVGTKTFLELHRNSLVKEFGVKSTMLRETNLPEDMINYMYEFLDHEACQAEAHALVDEALETTAVVMGLTTEALSIFSNSCYQYTLEILEASNYM